MKPTDERTMKDAAKLTVSDMLCSTGYLPPRNEQDLERFESIYEGQVFETEDYVINADAIFGRVLRQSTVYEAPSLREQMERRHRLVASVFDDSNDTLVHQVDAIINKGLE